jgi:hypothetical protein
MVSITGRVRGRVAALLFGCVLALAAKLDAQSTFGTVLGTVKDPSGGLVPMATVHLTNTGTNAARDEVSDTNGRYQFNNVDVGNYQLSVDASGFQKTEYQPFDLAARETQRIDIELRVASQAETVTVEAVATIQTEVSNIAETKGSLELTDLPVAIGTRATGSTSAFSTLGAQPGVQFDNTASGITVGGAGPSQLSISVDGISTIGPGNLGALTEMFPSFNSIEEIKISEVLNPAEFGGVADITTVSKSGTNEFHGGLFENVQNTAFDAADTFSHLVTPVKMNDFGGYLGGPVIFPKLYNGRNHTFFFGSYEVLRLPKSQQVIGTVPTAAMRNGDLSAYLDPNQPGGGPQNILSNYPGNIIPKSQLNQFGQNLLNFFYPMPNYGPAGAIVNNYLTLYPTPINSAQGDIRIDQVINSKHSIYARYSYKNKRVTDFPISSPGVPGLPAPGELSQPQIYNSLTVAYNWVISPTLVNELRGGYSVVRFGYSAGVTAAQAAATLGLAVGPGELPEALPAGYDTPQIELQGFTGSTPPVSDTNPQQGTYQGLDTLTWTKGKHTFKFGGDFRYLASLNAQVFNNYRMGQYLFNGSALSSFFNPAATVPVPVDSMAGLLLGYPDTTSIATVVNPATDAYSKHYAFFAQDDFKISQSFTLNYGLRWEYHPAFFDKNDNLANLDPYYSSTVNGQTVQGAIIIPNQGTFANVNPAFVQSVAPLPVITAAQAGVPEALRNSSKKDFAPRVGFAWNFGPGKKMVLRGGYGRFIETLLSGSAINGWSVESSDVGTFSNSIGSSGQPVFSLPYSYPYNIAQPGSQFFDLATEIKYKDPIVEEWNLTLERDLGNGIGFRASYDGNHGYNLPVVADYDRPAPNTLGFFNPTTQAQIPFPSLFIVATNTNLGFTNYNAGTFSVHKRGANFQFEVSYTYAKDLTNLNGCAGSGASPFATEGGFGASLCDRYLPGIDYGNNSFVRRNRFLATFLYQLPFGKGKTLLTDVNAVVDHIVGGWVLSGVALFQTGPFMSVAVTSDPSGTGFNLGSGGAFTGIGGRADTVSGVSPYAGQSLAQWINPAAFVDPCALCGINGNPAAIGRFGDSMSGAVTGPGTQAVSLSLLKRFTFTERRFLEIGGQVANVFNHPNYAPPGSLTLGLPAFGTITAMQSGVGAEGAGPRQLQLTGRLTF